VEDVAAARDVQVEHSELNAWPAKQTFIHPFGPLPLDYNTTSEWGRAASARRRAADAKVDQELQEMEQQREEFYQGRRARKYLDDLWGRVAYAQLAQATNTRLSRNSNRGLN
jgi:hypothetical protein